jgi:ABC-type spermidine/putrescine transport system permease subunit II
MPLTAIFMALGSVIPSILTGIGLYVFLFQTDFGNFILITIYGLGFFALEIFIFYIYARAIRYIARYIGSALEDEPQYQQQRRRQL